MKQKLKKLSYWLSVSIVGTILGFSLQLASAWVPPGGAPPAGNVGAPINVSNIGQSKAGGLILNTGGAANGLIVQNGNVGIGTTSPTTKLDVNGGIRSRTLVNCDLKSDASGNFSCGVDATGGGGGSGTVTSITAGTGLSGGTITSTGTISLNTTGISTCNNATTSKIYWNGTNLACGTDQAGGGGGTGTVTSLTQGYGIDLTPDTITTTGSIAVDGNVLNTSATGQSKIGGLVLNTGGATNGLIVQLGNVGIGDSTPDSGTGGQLVLDVAGNVGASMYCDSSGNNCKAMTSIAQTGSCTSGQFVTGISATGAPSCAAPSGSGVTGSGTLNYVAKWTPSGTQLGNSTIFDNGTNVGIGTTSFPSGEKVRIDGGGVVIAGSTSGYSLVANNRISMQVQTTDADTDNVVVTKGYLNAKLGAVSITNYNNLPSGAIAGHCIQTGVVGSTSQVYEPAYASPGCACRTGWTRVTTASITHSSPMAYTDTWSVCIKN